MGKISRLLWSRDGRSGSAPAKVAPDRINVHDTYAPAKPDGGFDLYYAGTNEHFAGGFSIFRRSVVPGRELGSEERVTAREAGSLIEPQVDRFGDPRLLLAIEVLGARGEIADLKLAWLSE